MASVNKEYEVRIMIDEDQYKSIIEYFSMKNKSLIYLINKNYYFDDNEHYLLNHHQTLRLRVIDGQSYEFTLKSKGKDGDIEINDELSKEEANDLLSKNIIPQGLVKNKLDLLNVTNIACLTSLETMRLEILNDDHILVIDKNVYSDITDYNIEIESTTISKARKCLKKYCELFHLDYQNTNCIGKASRAIKARLKN